MKNELMINGFSAVSKKEMLEVDGGGIWAGIVATIGAIAGGIISVACPPAGGLTVAFFITSVTAGATGGSAVGGIIEHAFNS